ncbi:Uncharacterized protein dnm_025190 [Desulfonema magnum]|uniref:Uncharacterized protein n=1 Tax=Desulfonema magnum TaxID=45655 RepID=A0A975BJL1_9BACT|nr:Uncharacterized protein dnm_025190 [Desulfonema magnum]
MEPLGGIFAFRQCAKIPPSGSISALLLRPLISDHKFFNIYL